ncbi:hypothetical protein P0F20_003189 [Vibrio metschnikovii]|uniref:hypothetical protein n=1 Tax=Vibrio metschnikovii TaxID=28172 RepID=UPI002FCC7E9E|nr:hypothetical protein [Vibrio metschnikovii]
MEWIIAVTGALISAIVGGFFGHHMTVRLFKIRVNKQEDALYLELKLIFDKYKRDLINKYNDYQCKFRQELMLSVPSVDYSLIDALTLELASSHKVLNQDARDLIVNLKKLTQNLDNLSLQRMENFKFENDHDEFLKITKRILVSEIQIVFYTFKFVNDKEKFKFGKYNLSEMAKVSCELSGISFDHNVWKEILPDRINEKA